MVYLDGVEAVVYLGRRVSGGVFKQESKQGSV